VFTSVNSRLGIDEATITTVSNAVTSVNSRLANDETSINSYSTSITSLGSRFTSDESTTSYNAASLNTALVNYVNSINARSAKDESSLSTAASQIVLLRPGDTYLTMSHYRYLATMFIYNQMYWVGERVIYQYFYGCCYYGWNYYGTGGYFPVFYNSYSQYFQMDFSGDLTHLASGQSLSFRMCFEWNDPGAAGASGYFSAGIYGPPGPLLNFGLTLAGSWKTRQQCSGYYDYQYSGIYSSYPIYSTCSSTATNCWPFFYSTNWNGYNTGFTIETARTV